MFWRFSYSTSQLQTLLERPDVTLKDILDEDDVLQECKSNNEKLIEFLTKETSMEQLIENIIRMPSNETNEKARFKYSNVSCELLTSDIAFINDSLIGNVDLLDRLYSFLDANSFKKAKQQAATSLSMTQSQKHHKSLKSTSRKAKRKTKSLDSQESPSRERRDSREEEANSSFNSSDEDEEREEEEDEEKEESEHSEPEKSNSIAADEQNFSNSNENEQQSDAIDDGLNPLLASYFAKVVGILISRKTEQFLNYLEKKENFVDLFVKHVNTSAIMDILLRLLTTIDNNEMRLRVLEWLKRISMIENLIGLFSSAYDSQVHSNVAQVLCDIIRISREQIYSDRETFFYTLSTANSGGLNFNDPFGLQNNVDFDFDDNFNIGGQQQQQQQQQQQNQKSSTNNEIKSRDEKKPPITNPLLESIESKENINKLLDLIIESAKTKNCSIVYGIEVLLTILEPKTSTYVEQYDSQCSESDRIKKERERILIASNGIKNVVECCLSRMNDLNDLLINIKTTNESFQTTHGQVMPMFGSQRLALVKLIAKLVAINNPDLNQILIKHKTLNVLIDFVFEFKWNNFLHTQITNIFSSLFSNSESAFRTIQILDESELQNSSNSNRNDVEMLPEKEEKSEPRNSEEMQISSAIAPLADEKSTSTTNLLRFKEKLTTDDDEDEEAKQREEKAKQQQLQQQKQQDLKDLQSRQLIIEHLFNDCNIIKKLTQAWMEYFYEDREKHIHKNQTEQTESAEVNNDSKTPQNSDTITTLKEETATKKSLKVNPSKLNMCGYIGHLTLISNLLYENSRQGINAKFIEDHINRYPDREIVNDWKELNETKISDINKINSKDLVRNPLLSNMNDLGAESAPLSLADIASDSASDDLMQKKLKDFQKEMKVNCVDQFSISENHIISFQPKFPDLFNKLQNISFQMESNDEHMQLFEQVCSQRDNMCMAINETSSAPVMEEDMWITKEIKFDDEFTTNPEPSNSINNNNNNNDNNNDNSALSDSNNDK